MRPLPIALLALATLFACGTTPPSEDSRPSLSYVGSSTIGTFLEGIPADRLPVRLSIDTEPESAGGEEAIREGRADLAGVARVPHASSLALGLETTLIGRDAIAIVIHARNPIEDLTTAQLEGIFTGRIRNWKELGGEDLEIRPFVVGPESATRNVVRAAIMGTADYEGTTVVRPDRELPSRVEEHEGAIGAISLSLFPSDTNVKIVSVDGHLADPNNLDYRITRPLFLMWWPGRERVKSFIQWLLDDPVARRSLSERFSPPEVVSPERP